jgi:hypothetical protein
LGWVWPFSGVGKIKDHAHSYCVANPTLVMFNCWRTSSTLTML